MSLDLKSNPHQNNLKAAKGSDRNIYEFEDFRLDVEHLMLCHHGSELSMTPKVVETLLALVEHSGEIVSKDELMERLWGDAFVEESNLIQNIHVLRKTLGDHSNGKPMIETLRRRGYRFNGKLKQCEEITSEADQKKSVEGEFVGNGTNRSSSNGKSAVFHNGSDSTVAVSKPLPAQTQTQRRTIALVLMSCIALSAILGFIYWWRTRTDIAALPPIRSIAVLPFENLSGDQAQDYFSGGMTEALNTELSKIGDLSVIDCGPANRYRDSKEGIKEIASDLGVEGVVKGTATRFGDHIRITVHLFRADTGQNIWSESYERDYGDAIVLQGTIARAIAEEIKVKLTTLEQTTLASTNPVKPEALDAYLEGLYLFNGARNGALGDREATFLKAAAAFERAVAIEPNYVDARAYLTTTYAYLAFGHGRTEYWAKMYDSAQAVLRLDESNARAHADLALMAWRYNWDRAEAERQYKMAFERAPNIPGGGLGSYALFLSSEGRQEEAITQMKRAIQIDPFDNGMKMNIGAFYNRAGQYDKAIDHLGKLLDVQPNDGWTRFTLGEALALDGRFPEAIAETEKGIEVSRDSSNSIKLAWVYAKAGDKVIAVKTLDEAIRSTDIRYSTRTAYDVACVYAELGEKDQAFLWLERLYTAHAAALIWLKVDPEFEKLHGDARYDDLVRRIGLTP